MFSEMEIISPEYQKKVADAVLAIRDKRAILKGLWNKWDELGDDIRELYDKALAVHPELPSDGKANSGEGESSTDVMEHFLSALTSCKEKWVKKMEESEKVCFPSGAYWSMTVTNSGTGFGRRSCKEAKSGCRGNALDMASTNKYQMWMQSCVVHLVVDRGGAIFT